ncbi:hypothetical protein CGLO_10888 [Colletotrichum gloeosporioides Cg-14]|uniref:Uncharacterized protein n=1 Tax=Colletotrichum gloeosporioides (strain Cg-14) TaxID=1237896 RepID=T0LNE8_COLGC|nr:hypothetical protein CGLO_10888 [Colletotrichum gloeosporioides Cg-14]
MIILQPPSSFAKSTKSRTILNTVYNAIIDIEPQPTMQITGFTAAMAAAFFAASASATCTTSWPGYACNGAQLACCMDISYGVMDQSKKDENWRYAWTRANCNTCKA